MTEMTPDFERVGGKAVSTEGSLKKLTVEQIAPNIVIFYQEKESLFKSAGWIMIYFMDSEQAARDMKASKIDYPMFIPGTKSMRWNGYSMINALWKKGKGQPGEMPDTRKSRDAKIHVVGALEAYRTKDGLYVDNISVRPGWKRNTIATKMMQALKNHFPGLSHEHSASTKEGHAFLKSTGNLKHTRRADTSMHEAVSQVITHLLEDEDEGWYGVDLDGTLAKHTSGKYRAEKIGKPIPKMVARVRRWVSHGKKVKIFTARADDEKSVNAIKKWLKDNELPDLEVTNLKDHHLIELWDDRAVAVKRNTGEIKDSLPVFPYEDFIGEAIEGWKPDEQTLSWFRRLLGVLNRKAIWTVPATGQTYQIDQDNKIVTLMHGDMNDANGWHAKNKIVFNTLGFDVHDSPESPDEMSFSESHELLESPEIATLKKNQVKLEPEEREQAMKAGAVWQPGNHEKPTCAIKKAVVKGKTWYWCATHRAGRVAKTLAKSIKDFDWVQTTS